MIVLDMVKADSKMCGNLGHPTFMVSIHEKFAQQLSQDERMLILLRDELYGGSWDQMLKDLQERLKGRPYIFKLVNRIQEDLERIEKLHQYEKKHKINLSEFIKKE